MVQKNRVAEDYFSNDVLEFLFLLNKYEVEYLIVGGEAVIYYGHIRLTGDIDLFYFLNKKNSEKLFEALLEFWDGDIPGINKSDELLKRNMVFQFGVPPNRIDLINDIEAVDFKSAWKNKNEVALTYKNKNFRIFYIGIEELIKNKSRLQRPRDMEDLKFLKQTIRK